MFNDTTFGTFGTSGRSRRTVPLKNRGPFAEEYTYECIEIKYIG
jgi:hypothetical protein